MSVRPLLAFVLPLVSSVSALAFARTAHASPVMDTTGSIGDNGGMQGVVSGPGPASTYFDPALLVDAEETALVSMALVSEQIGVTLDGRRGGDVPLVVGGRDIVGPGLVPIPNDVVPSPWLREGCAAGTQPGTCPAPGYAARPRQARGSSGKTRTYLTLGFVKHFVPDRFSVGAYMMLPLSSFTTARGFYADEREALFSNSLHPELYGDRLTAISIAVGGAFKILPELSIGVGLSIALANAASSSSYVRDSTNSDTLLLDNTVTSQVDVAPMVGARWMPVRRLRIGAALHSPESFTIDTTITSALPSGTESRTMRHEVYDWMPWRFSVGAEADAIQYGAYTMSITGSVQYAAWSGYQDRHGHRPTVYGDDLAWKDTMRGALGVRHKYGSVRGFIDLTYVPSPVPDQIARSNYVDNDRVGIHAGADVDLHIGKTHIRPGLQVFGNRLIHRHVTKDDKRIVDELPDGSVLGSTHDPVPGRDGLQTNNPGWPGFASAGWLFGGAVTLSIPL
jgi:hypothetical protein